MSWIVSIEFTAKRDWTALHHAANDQNIDDLRRLLNNNDVDDAAIDVDDANNPKHETPLMLAASTGNEQCDSFAARSSRKFWQAVAI